MPLVKVPGIGEIRFPDDMSHDQIVNAIENDVIPQYTQMIEPAKGLKEPLVGGIKRSLASDITGFTGLADATEAGKTGLARQQAIKERAAFSPEKIKYLYETQGILPAVGETIKEIPGTIEEQFPNLAKVAGGAWAGAKIPGPPQVKALGAIAGSAAALYPEVAGAHIERQAQEQQAKGEPININAASAYGEAIPSTFADALADRFAFGRLLGIKPSQIGTSIAEKIAERGLTRTLAGGAGKTMAAEIPTEVFQQMLERHQAGLPLADDSALDEYRKTAYQTAMLGPLGSIEGVSARSSARDQLAAEQQQRDKDLAAIAQERQRQQDIVDQAKQEHADITGADAVREEIARQEQETRAVMTDRLRQLLDKKTAAEQEEPQAEVAKPQLSLTTKEGIKDALAKENFDLHFPVDNYSKEERNQIRADLKKLMGQVPAQAKIDEDLKQAELRQSFDKVFGDHTIDELGIPRSKANMELLEPIMGARIDRHTPDAFMQPLEELKLRNKGKNDDEINSKIDEWMDKHLGSKWERTTPIDPNLVIKGSTTGYKFSPESQYQQDLFHLGESVNTPALRNETREVVHPEATTDVDKLLAELRGEKYEPTERQLGLDLGTEGDRGSVAAADVGGGTEPRYNRAEPITMGGTRATADESTTRERPDYNALGLKGKGWKGAQKLINSVLDDQTRNTSEKQAKDINIIAQTLETFGMPQEQAMQTALDMAAKHANWPTPEVSKRKRKVKLATTEDTATQRQEDIAGEADIEAEPDADALLASKRRFKRPAKSIEEEADLSPASVSEVENTLRKVIPQNAWNKNPPEIVDTYDQLPETMREEAESKGMKAFTDPRTGKDYYVASQMKTGKVLGSVMHERGGHIGLEKLIGKDRINALANRIFKWDASEGKAKGDKLGQKIAREAISRALESGEEIGSPRFNQEVIAYFTEVAIDDYKIDPFKSQPADKAGVAGWLRELWNGILNTIKNLHYNPDSITPHDIVELVHGAARIETTHADTATAEQLQASRKPSEQPTDTERQAAAAAGRTFFTNKQDYTLKDRVEHQVGGNWTGWLGNKLVGGGTSFEMKGTDFFGPEQRLNPETGKELGFLNYHRSLHDTDLATGAAANGYLDMDKEGVIRVVRSDDNVRNLNGLADKIKAAMKADGMSEAAATDAFSHMALADRFKELQQQGILGKDEFTPGDYAYGKELQRKYAQEYKEWQDMYQRIRGRTLDLMVKTGVFTRAKADEFLKRYEYVPFHREQDPNVSDGTFLRSLLSAKREFHIKGSDREVKNVMENILDNQVWLMKRAIRNNASNLIAETMDTMHKHNPLLGGKYTNIDDKSANTVEFLKDGELQRFKIIDKNDAAIFDAAPAVSNTAIRIMRAFTGFLRKGVTLMPSFMYNQIIQDAMRAPVVSGTEAGMFKLLRKSAPEFMKNIHSETELAKALRDAGIIGQIDYQDTYDNFKKELFGAERKGIAKYLEAGERMAQANDLATRVAVYDNVKQNGGSDNEASLRALMMINFQNRGHSQFMNYLMALAPFVNSRIQGEYRLLMALRGKIPGVSKAQAKQVIAWRMAKMAAFTAIYAMAASGDDDYERAGEEVKNHNFLMNGFKIPVAPEFLPFKVAIEKGYRLATDQERETGAKAFRAEVSALAGLAFGVGDVTPTAVKPLLENMTNYSFFSSRPLVGYSLGHADVNEQYNEGTSELAKWFSNVLFDAGEATGIGGNLLAISPIKLDNVMRGWFGSMGRDFLYTTDMLSGNKPAAKLNQMPVLGAMFYDQEGGALKSDFYELKDRADKATTTLAKLRQEDPEKAREYMDKNRPLIAMHYSINAMSNQLNQIRKQKARAIAQDPDTARDKITELDNRAYEMLKDRLPEMVNRIAEFEAEQ